MLFTFRLSKKEIISKRRYSAIVAMGWVYTIIWLSVLIATWYFWNTQMVYKILVSFFLVLGTPAITDLTRSYEQYQKEVENRIKSDGEKAPINT